MSVDIQRRQRESMIMTFKLGRYQVENEEARKKDTADVNEQLKQVLLNGDEIIAVSASFFFSVPIVYY